MLCDYKYWVGEKGSGFTLMNTLSKDMVCLTRVYAAVDMLLQSSDWADTSLCLCESVLKPSELRYR